MFVNFLIVNLNVYMFDNENSTFHLSFQSRTGYNSEPTGLLLLILILSSTLIFAILKPSFKFFSKNYFVRSFGLLQIPISIVIIIYLVRLAFQKISVPDLDYKILLSNQSPDLNVFILIVLTTLLNYIFIYFKVLKVQSLKIYSFLNPLLVLTSQLLLELLKINILREFTISITLFVLYALAVRKIELSKLRTGILFYFILSSTIIFIPLYAKRPYSVVSWRPNFVEIQSSSYRYVILTLIISLISSLFITYWVTVKRLINATSLFAAFFALSTFPISKTEIASLDNFHYGESIGLWYLTNRNSLIPYSQIEYPRGLLSNYIPAAFSNLLTPGIPENFRYWYFFLFFVICLFLVFLARGFMNYYVMCLLLFFIPWPQGLSEIDYVGFIFILLILYLIKKNFGFDIVLISSILLGVLAIFLFPGQGFIVSLLLIAVNLYLYLVLKQRLLRKWSIFVLFSISIFVYSYLSSPLLAAIRWTLDFAGVNQLLFGDNWFHYIRNIEALPINLRWITIYFVPIFVFFFLYVFNKISKLERLYLLVIIFYFILISGRWFGRVDINNNSLSRLGVGFNSLSLFLLIPIIYLLSKQFAFLKFVNFFLIFYVVVASVSLKNVEFIQGTLKNTSFTSEDNKALNVFLTESDFAKRGENLVALDKFKKTFFEPSEKVLNVTGGAALDFYMSNNSVGGLQSPYMVAIENQDKRWLDRIKLASPKFFIGPYGTTNLGGLLADSAPLSNKSPFLMQYLIDEFVPINCDIFFVGILKDEYINIQKKLRDFGCRPPESYNDLISYWNIINGLEVEKIDLGISLYSWKSQDLNMTKFIDKRSVYIVNNSAYSVTSVRIRCKFDELSTFTISGKLNDSESFSQAFTSQTLKDGQISFRSSLFIVNYFLLNPKLTLENPNCYFYE